MLCTGCSFIFSFYETTIFFIFLYSFIIGQLSCFNNVKQIAKFGRKRNKHYYASVLLLIVVEFFSQNNAILNYFLLTMRKYREIECFIVTEEESLHFCNYNKNFMQSICRFLNRMQLWRGADL